MSTQTYTATLTIVHCATCSMPFGVSKHFEQERRSDHKSFYCPAGHSQHWPQETDKEKLRRQLKYAKDSAATERARRDQAEASLRATKGVVTRQRKKLERVKNGVCPCCNRSFTDLKKHMKTRHPEWDGGVG